MNYFDEPELILSTDSHFGRQLKEVRLSKGIRLTTLSKSMGCVPSNIGHFEKGDNTFGNGSLTTVFKYAKALGFTEIKFKIT